MQFFQEIDRQRREYEAYRMQARQDPERAERVARIHRQFPNLDAGVVMGAAHMGFDPDTPEGASVIQELANMSFKGQRNEGLGMHEPGEYVSPQQILREHQEVEQAHELAHAPDEAEEDDRSWLGDAARSVTRGVFTGLGSAWSEAWHGTVTPVTAALVDDDLSLGEAWERRRPGWGTLMAEARREGREIDLGDGWFPSGDILERWEKRKHDLEINDTWASPGRITAGAVTEPGTTAFNVLSGAIDGAGAIFADPAAWATGGLAKVRHANKTFQSLHDVFPTLSKTGVLNGVRKATSEELATHWWNNAPEARALAQHIANDPDPYRIWTTLRKKADRNTVLALSRARNVDEVDAIMRPKIWDGRPQGIGLQIDRKPTGHRLNRALGRITPFGDRERASAVGLTAEISRGLSSTRMLQWTPHRTISAHRMEQTLEDVDRYMRSLKMSPDERTAHFERIAQVPDGDQAGLLEAMMPLQREAFRKMSDYGMDEETATRLTRLTTESYGDTSRYFIDHEIGGYGVNPLERPFLSESGELVTPGHSPHLWTELMNRELHLPFARDVRRAVHALAPYIRRKEFGRQAERAFHMTHDGIAGVVSRFWKPMQLLRAAYITRIGIENQFRMAAAGYNSAVNHPIDWIMWMVTRGKDDLAFNNMNQRADFVDSMQTMGGKFLRDRLGEEGRNVPYGLVPTNRYKTIDQNAPLSERARGFAEELEQAANDPIAKRVANGGLFRGDRVPDGMENAPPIEQIVEYYWRGDGVSIRRGLEKVNPDVGRDRNLLRDYIVESVQRRVDEIAVDADIRQMIATGNLPEGVTRGGRNILAGRNNRKLRNYLERDKAGSIPKHVKVEELEESRQFTGMWDRMVDWLGEWVMSKPENVMARSVTFRQAYFNKAEELMGYMPAHLQDELIQRARDVGLSRSQLRRLEHRKGTGTGNVIEDMTQVDALAGEHATSTVKTLLYDLSERGQFSDATRAIMPFAEAWKEIGLAWTRIVRERGTLRTMRDFHRLVHGARSADWNEDGRGFFFPDPMTGQEMFVYPGSRLLTNAMIDGEGHRIDMAAPVEGINLFAGSIIPGLGPAVQIPASAILPHTPRTEWVRENIFFPFGEPSGDHFIDHIQDAALPGWFNHVLTGMADNPENDRIYANSIADVMNAMAGTGEFDPQDEGQLQDAFDTARGRARYLSFIRGLASGMLGMPAIPQYRYSLEDLDGNWWMYNAAGEAYYEKVNEYGQEPALEWFMQVFGPDSTLLTQAKSRELVHSPADSVAANWLRENEDLAERYPDVVGLFAPSDPSSPFDYAKYLRDFEEGRREALTPQQRVWLHNNTLARIAYNDARERLENERGGLGQEERMLLNRFRAHLQEEFHGFDTYVGITPSPDADHLHRQLERALREEPRFRESEAGRGAMEYLAFRQQAQQMGQEMLGANNQPLSPDGWKQSESARPIRQWLRRKAAQIGERHPEFITIWERVYERELAEDEDPQQPDQMIAPGV